MGRKVYHVFKNYDEYLATFTSIKKALEFATSKFKTDSDIDELGIVKWCEFLVTSYDLQTHEHWDIWYSSFLKKEKGEQK